MDDTQDLECTQALPDDWDNEESAPNEQHLVAWLEINGSRHDVHEGETTIGRDATACKIVLQNKVLSKRHAVLEVEGNLHTIADLGSMNKTRIGKMILKPNVRYALQGGESLKFGDLQAKYIIKVETKADDSGSETGSESMLMLNDSEERPISPVIGHHLPDFVPETPVTANVHSTASSSNTKSYVPESPSISQSTPLPQKNSKMTLFSSPGSVSAIQNLVEDEDSFFFDPSQQPKEKAANTSDTGRIDGLNTEGYNSDESTDIEDDFGPTLLFADNEDSKKEDESDTSKDPSKNEDAPETSEDCSRNYEDTFKGVVGNVPLSEVEDSSKDKDMKIRGENEKGWNSDGSTDSEEDIFRQATQTFSIQDKTPRVLGNDDTVNNISPALKNYDNTQEIMEAFGDTDDETMLPTQLFVAKESPPNKKFQELDDDISTQLFVAKENPPNEEFQELDDDIPTQLFVAKESPPNKKSQELDDDIPTQLFLTKESPPNKKSQELDDDIPTQLFYDNEDEVVFKKPIAKAPKNKRRLTDFSSTSKSFDDDNPDDLLETANAAILDTPTQPYSCDDQHQPSTTSSSDEGLLDAPTLPFDDSASTYEFQLPRKTVQKDKYRVKCGEDDEIDDLFNQPTQPFLPNDDADTLEEDIPTQYFDPTPKNETPEKGESDIKVDRSNQPTQIFSAPKDDSVVECNAPAELENIGSRDSSCNKTNVTSLILSPMNVKEQAEDHGNEDDLPPTQIFSAPKDGADIDSNAPTQLSEVKSVLHCEDRNIQEGTSKVDARSQLVVPASHIKRQMEVHSDNDDDLPPTQIFSSPKDYANVDGNAPTQLFDVESALHSESRITEEGTNKVDMTSQVVSPVVHMKAQTEVDVNEDDLPPTQIFTAHSPSKQAPDPTVIEDTVSLVQPILCEASSESKGVSSANAIKVSRKCLADDNIDSQASTLVLRESSLSESEDDDSALTQPLTDDGNNNKSDTPPVSLSSDSKESKEPPPSSIQVWDELDADATQDISIDGVVGIDETCVCTTVSLSGAEQKDNLENSALNDSASDVSETLLNDRQLGDEEEVILSDFKNDSSHSGPVSEYLPNCPDSERIESVQDQKDEEGIKDLEMDHMEAEKKEQTRKCINEAVEEDTYNSGESTDVEDYLLPLQDDIIPVTKDNITVTQGNEKSHVELSSSSDILGNKVCSSLCKESPEVGPKQQNSVLPPTVSLKVSQETINKEADTLKKSFQFKRVSKMVPVVSSPDHRASAQNQSTHDSCMSVDFSLSNISFADSEDSKSQETISDDMQAPEKEGKVLEHHRDIIDSGSDNDNSVHNFSQRLFDLPPDEGAGTGNTSKDEKIPSNERKTLEDREVVEKLKGKNTKAAREVIQKDMVMIEGKAEEQENIGKVFVKDVAHENKRKVPDYEELGFEKFLISENGSMSGNISVNDRSTAVTPKRNKGLKPTAGVQSHLTYENETDSSTNSERSPRSESTDHSGNKNDENDSFSGFEKSPKNEESSDINRHKDDKNKEKSDFRSENVQDLEESTKGEDNLLLKTKEFDMLETSSGGFFDRNAEVKQQSDYGLIVMKTNETDRHSVSICQRKRGGKDEMSELPDHKVEENVLSARDKRKRNESMKLKVVKQNKVKQRTRSNDKDTDSEISSRNSSTSRDSVDEVTLEDVSDICHSGRRRKNSDASTLSSLSHLSSSSNQNADTAADDESGSSVRKNWRTRTKYQFSDTEISSRNSSSSRDSVGDVTLDDVQNIRRSNRRRNISGTSTQSSMSHLSSSSSHSEARSAATALRVSPKSTVKRGRRSKRSSFGRINVPSQETEEKDDKISSCSEKSSIESDISTNTSRKKTSQKGKSKGVTRRSCRNLGSTDIIDVKKIEVITPKTEISSLPKETEGLTYGQTRSRRSQKELKKFSPNKDIEAEALKGTSGRIGERRRKSDVLQIISEPTKRLPPRRARRSAMPNLFVSTSVMNDEEVEIVPARKRSTLGLSFDNDDHKNKTEMLQISKRESRSSVSKAKVVKQNEASIIMQEADTCSNETKHPEAVQNSRKSRSSIATSQLTGQQDPVVPKKPKLSTIPEKSKDEESRDTVGLGRRIQKRAPRSQKGVFEEDAGESKSKVDNLVQGLEKKRSKRGQLLTAEWSDESTAAETGSSRSSSQSSEDSHVCRKSKRKRGSDNSMEELLSTPKSSRSGRSRMGSPSVKDSYPWSPSQRQQQANTRPRVLFTGYKDAQDEKIVTDLGGTVVEYPQECTVLVTTNIRRTCKLLAVIGKGLPIVSPSWLTVSKQARNFVDPWKFLVKDTEAEEKFGFRLEQSLKSASKVLLFEGLSIHATISVKPPPDQMKVIPVVFTLIMAFDMHPNTALHLCNSLVYITLIGSWEKERIMGKYYDLIFLYLLHDVGM
ncbi:uncharacterized protein [Panulirus ornatus]|uniref:uncharacterized protein isoform X2 n=1 Tax=Panulirus ornatus TaxID=150431 RepID=UPI003A8C431F